MIHQEAATKFYGERVILAVFVDVVCWRDLAEAAAARLVVGDRVVISGSLGERVEESHGLRGRSLELLAREIGLSLVAAS
jgi:single-stranded DNA-binding protein